MTPAEATTKILETIKQLRASGLEKEQIVEHPDYIAAQQARVTSREEVGTIKDEWREELFKGKSATSRGKMSASLEKEMNFADVSYRGGTLKHHIERLIESGYSVIFTPQGHRVLSNDGVNGYGVSALGKVGMDYAATLSSMKYQHLSAKKSTEEAPKKVAAKSYRRKRQPKDFYTVKMGDKFLVLNSNPPEWIDTRDFLGSLKECEKIIKKHYGSVFDARRTENVQAVFQESVF